MYGVNPRVARRKATRALAGIVRQYGPIPVEYGGTRLWVIRIALRPGTYRSVHLIGLPGSGLACWTLMRKYGAGLGSARSENGTDHHDQNGASCS